MQKTFFILMSLAFCSLSSFGQMCGSKARLTDEPYTIHYGKNELLKEVGALIKTYKEKSSNLAKTTSSHVNNGVLFNIPLKVWVYNKEAPATPSPAMSDAFILMRINQLNTIYAPAGIRFYLKCQIEQVFDNRFWAINTAEEDQRMKETYHDEWALNMHIIGNGSTGRGEFPWYGLNASFSIASSNINHIAHEIGHSLGLYHTFESRRGGTDNGSEGKCYQEAVSRSKKQGIGCLSTIGKKKCDINGDGFCDTQADYSTSDDFRNGSCGYTGTKEDNWGDRFTPPSNNIMSYWWSCRDSFTSEQFSAMVIYLGVYTPFIRNYFSHNGVSFMNLNSIDVKGDVNSGESEKYIVPEDIVNNDILRVQNGGNLSLQAQNNITLKPGFSAVQGANFQAFVGVITNCNDTYKSGSNNRAAKNIQTEYQNDLQSDFQNDLNALINKHLTNDSNNLVAQKIKESEKEHIIAEANISLYPTIIYKSGHVSINYELLENDYIKSVKMYTLSGVQVDSFIPPTKKEVGVLDVSLEKISQSGVYFVKVNSNAANKVFRILIK